MSVTVSVSVKSHWSVHLAAGASPVFPPVSFPVALLSPLPFPPLSHQTIKATSPLGDPRVTYNLEEGQVPETNMPVRFYVKPNRADGSASILVAENLDYETTRFFTLRVRVQNVAAVPLASFTTVYVNVTGEAGGGVCVLSW